MVHFLNVGHQCIAKKLCSLVASLKPLGRQALKPLEGRLSNPKRQVAGK